MIISAIVRSGAFPLFTNHGDSDSGDEKPESRYFKPFRGILLHKAMKRHCIKIDVLIDPCKGSGNILSYYFDVLREMLEFVIKDRKIEQP